MFDWLSSDLFMPHGHCYLWRPGLLWLQVITNMLIGLSYVAIFSTLAYLVRKGKYLPFKGMAVAFGVFILACGVTHFFDVYVIWHPAYWADGLIRAVTAAASVGTALLLPPLVPKALAVARAAGQAHERGEKLEVTLDQLETTYERTRELEQLKTRFFANVSHELRTPLTLVLGPAERMLGDDNLTDEQRRDLEVIARNGRTLLGHVEGLLEVSRLEAGKVAPSYTRLDLVELVRRTSGNFDGIARERDIELSVDVPETLAVEADRGQLERVLLNIMSNAFKVTPSEGRIRIALAAADDRATIEVGDSGPGIEPGQREVVFERFRQVDGGPTREAGGTGLGLAIARDFVTLHGGAIEVDEAPEGGALLRFEIPLEAPDGATVAVDTPEADRAAEIARRRATEELREVVDAVAQTSGRRATLLVVEDNPEMLRYVRETLAGDYRVVTATSGREGLEAADRFEPDLIVTDVMMPEMSGDEMVRQMREQSRYDAVPIISLTAKADDDLRIQMLQQGAQDYLTKPFSAAELRARVDNLVTIKRARDLLSAELGQQSADLEALAREVTHRRRELETALAAIELARDHAERASQLKSDFLRTVSHELRTPLAALNLQLERLRVESESPSEPQMALTGRMAGSIRRLQELIEGLLQYARAESGRLELEPDDVDVGEMVRDVADRVSEQASRAGLALEIEAPEPGAATLRTDPRILHLILVNLAGNAIKFTESGEVRLGAAAEGDGFVFEVKDSGPGIGPEDRVRIFEPFFQTGDAHRRGRDGFGLGLALVRDMTAALNGRIMVESEVGHGTLFRVFVPPTAS